MAGRQESLDRCTSRYEAALKASEKAGPGLAKLEIALGLAYVDVGSIRQGLFYLQRARSAEEAHLKEAPGVYAEAMEGLAYVHGLLEEPDMQIDALGRALRLRQAAGDLPALAWVMVLMADYCGRHGDLKQQAALLQQSAALLEGRPEDQLLRKVALCLLAAMPGGRGGKAAPVDEAVGRYFGRLALAGAADHASGRRTPETDAALVEALLPLGEELADKTIPEQKKIEDIIQALNKKHGASSIDTAQALVVLADVHGDQGEQAVKMQTLKQVLRIQEQTFGFDSIYVTSTLKGLAHACKQLGDIEHRLDFLRRALDLQEEEFGADHPQTTTTRYYVQVAQAEARQLVDPEGTRELQGIFGRTRPTNPKVNRLTGEGVFQEGLGPSRSAARPIPPFPMESSGGGACAWSEGGGLEVPFYYTPTPVA